MVETLQLAGTLEGHNGWVTSLATCAEHPDILVSGSRDKSVIVWTLTPGSEEYGVAKKSLRGHSHFVQDVAISHDGGYVLSASWDKTLRLWDLNDASSTRFVGHEGDVLSCDFSADNVLIVSGSRDKTIKLWNVIGNVLYTIDGSSAHSDWVSSVRVTPTSEPRIISAGYDKLVKSWDIKSGRLVADFVGHHNYVSVVTLAPDGTLCASAGKDGIINMWSVEPAQFMYSLPGGDEVYTLAFSPSRYWLAAATKSGIKVYDLQKRKLLEELRPEVYEAKEPVPTSLTWASDGQVLFAGYTDNKIRVWQVMTSL